MTPRECARLVSERNAMLAHHLVSARAALKLLPPGERVQQWRLLMSGYCTECGQRKRQCTCGHTERA